MGNVRLNTEKKIENDSFKIKIGTTNRINPVAIYIEGGTFLSPLEEKDDYSDDISDIKHSFRNSIIESLRTTNYYDRKFISDFEIASNGIKKGKKSYLSFQILLKQSSEKPLKLKDIKEKSENLINYIANNLKSSIESYDFSINKTKKRTIY